MRSDFCRPRRARHCCRQALRKSRGHALARRAQRSRVDWSCRAKAAEVTQPKREARVPLRSRRVAVLAADARKRRERRSERRRGPHAGETEGDA